MVVDLDLGCLGVTRGTFHFGRRRERFRVLCDNIDSVKNYSINKYSITTDDFGRGKLEYGVIFFVFF